MILDRLTLHNFCLYKGQQVFDLAPESRDRPVVLVGGLNGGGKTTLLDAVQLALYGNRALVSKREGIPYEKFLGNCINRGVDPTDGASVGLQFRYVSEGEQKLYEVRRSWSLKKSNVRESVTVLCDGKPDRHLSDHWNDIVEELIPLGISRLFFFDAEQVRFLADDDSSHVALGSAVKSLLGLDLAEKLIADASVLENRLSARLAKLSDDPNYKVLLKQMETLGAEIKIKKQQRAAIENDRLRANQAEEKAESEFKQIGGPHWLEREARKQELVQSQAEERSLKETLVRLAATDLPLSLVPDLVDRVRTQDEREQMARESKVIAKTLTDRDKEILERLKNEGAKKDAILLIKKIQDQDRKERSKLATEPLRHGLSDRTRVAVEKLGSDSDREAAQSHLDDTLSKLESVKAKREQLERSMELAPEESSVLEVFAAFKAATERAAKINATWKSLSGEVDVLEKEWKDTEVKVKAIQRKSTDSEIDAEEAGRMIKMAVRTQETMSEYLKLATQRKIEHLSKEVGDAFQFLLRKQSLIQRVEIDPATFRITLYDTSGEVLPKERLSEGEKQIFAISVLWGLAKASPRPLPAIIDTPMARLDSEHRGHLIERYLPHASHQVIVLSTDSEVDRSSYKVLLPHVSHSYHLRYDEDEKRTEVEDGYFPAFCSVSKKVAG